MNLSRSNRSGKRAGTSLRAALLATAFGVGAVLGFGGAASAESLDDALAMAYSTNPTLAAARAELRSVDEGVQQALSGWRPTVTIEGSLGVRYIDTSTALANSQGTAFTRGVTLQVSQFLWRGGRTGAEVSQADHVVQAQRAVLLSVEQDVLLRAVAAYMDLIRDQAVVELNRNNEEVLSRQLQATRDRFQVGELTLTDVAQGESRLSGATAARIAADGALSTSRAIYEEVVGMAPGTLVPAVPLSALPGSVQDVVAAAQAASPAVVAAEYLELAAQDGIDISIGELLPTVSLVGQLSYDRQTNFNRNDSRGGALLAQVSVPLYQSGAVHSRVRQSKQTASQRRLEVDEARRGATQAAVSAWEALQTAQAQITSLQAQVRAADVALDGITQEALVGTRTVLDVLDTKQDQLDAQVALVRAERDLVVAGYQVLASMGQLTAGRLGLPVEVYDPTVSYDRMRDRFLGVGLSVD